MNEENAISVFVMRLCHINTEMWEYVCHWALDYKTDRQKNHGATAITSMLISELNTVIISSTPKDGSATTIFYTFLYVIMNLANLLNTP